MVDCCVVGCGPAGAMVGLLLARAGAEVVVLEKHADFLRDFRGDTIHPSTLEILNDLGLADRFLSEVSYSKVSRLEVRLPGGDEVSIDFRELPTTFPFIAFVPQWDFLRFVTAEAQRYAGFRLVMQAEVVDLLHDHGGVTGAVYRTPDGALHEISASLTVGADGRGSRVREAAQLPLVETSPPMDVLWFRLSRQPGDSESVGLRLSPGHFFGLISRRDYWQVAYVIPKGAYGQVHAAGLASFRQAFAEGVPELADRIGEIQDWDHVKLLTVRADRLQRWYRPGLLCIGDAAHAMSPVAGVGINVAIQDAVEAANLVAGPLVSKHVVPVRVLARVQRRRELAVRLTQAFQGLLQEQVVRPMLGGAPGGVPWFMRVGLQVPLLRRLPARLIALGVVRPRVRTSAVGRAVPS